MATTSVKQTSHTIVVEEGAIRFLRMGSMVVTPYTEVEIKGEEALDYLKEKGIEIDITVKIRKPKRS